MTIVITRRESLHLPDGINIFLFTLAEELIRRRHRVIAVSTCAVSAGRVQETFRCSKYPELVGLTTSDQLGYSATGTAWLRFGNDVLKKYSPEVTIVNGALPLRLPGRSIIVSHDVEPRVPRFRLLRIFYKSFCYRLADQIVATCTEIGDALAAEIHTRRSCIRIIPTCMNLANYTPKPLSQRTQLILHMGTVNYKNPLTTLKAFVRLRSPAARLQITGPLTPDLEDFIRGLPSDLRNRIVTGRFLPAQELKELLESARIVSVPSDYAVPVASPTVLESFATGTPVVCSRSISRDIIRDGENSIVADTPDAIAGAFHRLAEEDDLWQKLSAQARITIERFSAEVVAMQYEQLANE
jgi:glycosyltransferase involved in cell wall biosynthesis